MRILVTASTLPRHEGDAMPDFVLEQARALARLRPELELELLAPHDAGAARDEVLRGIPVHRFRYFWPARWQRLAYPAILPNIRRRWWLALQVPALIAAEFVAILARARRRRPDVIYSHWFTPQALAGSLAAALLGVPHVFTTHAADVAVLRHLPLLGPALVRLVTRHSRAYTAVSQRTAARLQAFFPGEARALVARRLRVIPMGVDTAALRDAGPAAQAAARIALGIGQAPALLFIGRLTEKKGVADLLKAAAKLRDARREFTLLVAGDGELREAVAGEIRALGLEREARLLGFVTGTRKQQCLAAADILVLPSIVAAGGDTEGLPVALLEGMAAGKLCVASDASGADEVLTDGEHGFIAPAGDPAGLAQVLAHALDLDPAAAQAIRHRGAERARDFDWAQVALAHYQHLFADIAAPGTPARR